MKNIFCLLFFCLSVSPLFAQTAGVAKEKHKIIKYKPQVGHYTNVYKESSKFQQLDTGPFKGFQVMEEKTITSYFQKILSVVDGKIVKMELTFQKVLIQRKMTQRGKVVRNQNLTIPLAGRTIVVTYQKGKPTEFQDKSGKSIPPQGLSFLKRKLSKNKEKENPLFPQKPLAEGERWKISPETVFKKFPFPKNTFDKSTSSAIGTLKKLTYKGKKKFGTIIVKIDLNVVNLPNFKNTRGGMKFGIKVTGCIDGSSPDENFAMNMNFKAKGEVRGMPTTLEIRIKMVQRTTSIFTIEGK